MINVLIWFVSGTRQLFNLEVFKPLSLMKSKYFAYNFEYLQII